MDDARSVLIDTAARALKNSQTRAGGYTDFETLAEAVIDALGIIALHGNSGFPVFRIACLSKPRPHEPNRAPLNLESH